MKNPANMLTFLLLGLAAFHNSPAVASEKMRDMSLSVEETNRQFANPPKSRVAVNDPGFYNDRARNGYNSYNGNSSYYDYDDYNNGYAGSYGFDANTPISPNMANQMDNISDRNSINARRPPPPLKASQQGFINRFCSPDYSPSNASSEAQQSCMDTQRQDACDCFHRAAVNIQRLLSRAIDCEANSLSYGSSGCDGLDGHRLDMLKEYWQDEDTSYTILFLPDMVLNSAANCDSRIISRAR